MRPGKPTLVKGWVPYLGKVYAFGKDAHKFLNGHKKKSGDIITICIAAHHFAILWASVGNTVLASFWAMYYLVMHPEALAVMRGEIDHVLQLTGQEAGAGHSITLTSEQLDSLVFSAINESLRLSLASMNIQIAQEDFTLGFGGDRFITMRKGDVIALYPQSAHGSRDF